MQEGKKLHRDNLAQVTISHRGALLHKNKKKQKKDFIKQNKSLKDKLLKKKEKKSYWPKVRSKKNSDSKKKIYKQNKKITNQG